MSSVFSLNIITPDKCLKYDDVTCIILRTTDGEISLLANHIDKISNIDITPLTIRMSSGEKRLALSSGVLYVNNKENTVNLIVDTVERAEDIDIARAKKAKIEAEDILASKSISNEEATRAERHLKKALIRIKVSEGIN